MAYLLLNAASYDGEILHAHVYRPCAGRAGFYVYRGRRYENNDIFHKYMQVGQWNIGSRSIAAGWLQQRKACALLLIAQTLQCDVAGVSLSIEL